MLGAIIAISILFLIFDATIILMTEIDPKNNEFISKIISIVEENLEHEQFGVSELADAVGMSRSNLLRKIKKNTNLSAAQFIRQVRLKHAMEMLKEANFTVSEVAFKVGFNSVSYFVKCFHDHYGFSPGETSNQVLEKEEDLAETEKQVKQKNLKPLLVVSFLFIVLIFAILYIVPQYFSKEKSVKSIAVLPFKNDSNDSTNVYFINGLMESILGDLQKIEDLHVLSRTSVEKYRNTNKTIPEIAKELNARYFIEGSGQKIGNKIFLNIQLIEANSDRHLWAEQYDREIQDVFDIQKEIARNIANEIEVIITPEEQNRINKVPTTNIIAYDLYLKGRDLLLTFKNENLEASIDYFKKAIEHDNEFALAFANIAIAYYFMDFTKVEKNYTNEINSYADKALLYDSKLAQSLIGKALYYMNIGQNNQAIPHLEKALEYNPNSARVINILSEFYTNYVPNTGKYLEYAIKGARLDIASHDSITASFIYLHLSNAFIQNGFVDEAILYIDKSISYSPENLFSQYVKAYIMYAKNRDKKALNASLFEAYQKDTNRLDILQELAKSYYFLNDYESAYKYYKKFVDTKNALKLSIYPAEDSKIIKVYREVGNIEEADSMLIAYKSFSDNTKTIYKHLNLGVYELLVNDTEKAHEHFALFAEEEEFQYWILLFIEDDPIIKKISGTAEFKKIMKMLEKNFYANHKELKSKLRKKDLI